MNERREAIQSTVRRILEQKGDRGAFADGDSLVLSGRLDSIDVLEIITFLEESFGTDFAESGFDQRELDSVNAILTRVSA